MLRALYIGLGKFCQLSEVSHTLDRVILESLHTNYASWKITFPTVGLTLYATKANATFSTDIALGTSGIIVTYVSGVSHTVERVIL